MTLDFWEIRHTDAKGPIRAHLNAHGMALVRPWMVSCGVGPKTRRCASEVAHLNQIAGTTKPRADFLIRVYGLAHSTREVHELVLTGDCFDWEVCQRSAQVEEIRAFLRRTSLSMRQQQQSVAA